MAHYTLQSVWIVIVSLLNFLVIFVYTTAPIHLLSSVYHSLHPEQYRNSKTKLRKMYNIVA